MIKTLKDLNQAGRSFWSRPNRDDAGKRAQVDVHPMTKHNAPPGMEKCPNCGGYGRKYGEPCDVCHGEGFIPEGSADKAKDAGGLPQEIADMLVVQGKMTLEQIQQELGRSGWDVTRGQVLVALAAAKAKNSGGVWRPE